MDKEKKKVSMIIIFIFNQFLSGLKLKINDLKKISGKMARCPVSGLFATKTSLPTSHYLAPLCPCPGNWLGAWQLQSRLISTGGKNLNRAQTFTEGIILRRKYEGS